MSRDVGDNYVTFQPLNARNLLSTNVRYNYPVLFSFLQCKGSMQTGQEEFHVCSVVSADVLLICTIAVSLVTFSLLFKISNNNPEELQCSPETFSYDSPPSHNTRSCTGTVLIRTTKSFGVQEKGRYGMSSLSVK